MARDIPRFVSVDDHVVEPPHLFAALAAEEVPTTAAPARRAPGHRRADVHRRHHLRDQTCDDAGPKSDCWFYEDLVVPHKRHVAAVGFDRDDMTLSPITYDEMRPGCYDPKARLDDMDLNCVEASLCFPTFPRFCGQTFAEAHGQGARAGLRARLQRLDGRGVVRRLAAAA